MNVEIERKFLVKSEAWRGLAEGVRFRQGYLQTHPCTVRVRTEGERGVLTIKGQTRGFSREEFEYEIPRGDADRMLDTLALPSLIDKIRYKIPYQGFVWEVDEFLGDNAGLVVAEIELSDEGQAFERPGWIGEEVTGDRRYANSRAGERPRFACGRRIPRHHAEALGGGFPGKSFSLLFPKTVGRMGPSPFPKAFALVESRARRFLNRAICPLRPPDRTA